MPKYSKTSQSRLYDCDKRLIKVFERVVQEFDNSILTGYREESAQDEMFLTGKSKVRWPDSKHNSYPSKAIDAAPFPIDWEDRERFSMFAGYVLGTAAEMGIRLRWGGDWDRDWTLMDNNFDDLVHFELLEK